MTKAFVRLHRVIDEDELAIQTGGDTALQLELLALLRAQLIDLGKEVDAFATGYAGPATFDLPAVLHRIRGAALAVGARDLAVQLGRAEADLAVDPASHAAAESLRAEIAAASVALASLIAQRGGPGLAKAGESR